MTNHSRTSLQKLDLTKLKPDDRIAPNFKLYELTISETASRQNIDNGLPGNPELRAAVNLARKVLQPIRDSHGSFTPNSVFRSQALERALKNKPVGWISTSQHTLGCACDVEIVGMSTLELAEWARDNLKVYDQIICECHDPARGINSGWVHISLRVKSDDNRKQLLSYVRNSEKTGWVYLSGLRVA